MTQQKVFRLMNLLVLIPMVVFMFGCQGVPAAQPTELPTTPEATATLPPTLSISLPDEAVKRLVDLANSKKLVMQPLAAQYTVIYALPDSGAAILLTPSEQPEAMIKVDLVNEPKLLENIVLGGLTVVTDKVNGSPFAVGDYLITLAPDGKTVQFTRSETTISFDAVIRSLPLALPPGRPVALITSSQMCLAWETKQICALAPTPLPENLKGELINGINTLGENSDDFALDRAIPDIEGNGMLETCAKVLGETPPAYDQCRATVLVAPAKIDSTFATPNISNGITEIGIGILMVLEPIQEEFFSDQALTIPVTELPLGNYRSFEILLDGETPVPEKPIATRVRQSSVVGGAQVDYYMPAISGSEIIGDIQSATIGPSNDEEAVIANLWVGRRCIFKRRQCPWLIQ